MKRVTARLGDLGWQAFALLTAAFMGVPLDPGRSVQLQSIRTDQLAVDRIHPGLVPKAVLARRLLAGLVEQPDRGKFSLQSCRWQSALWRPLVLARHGVRRAEILIGIISIPMMLPALIIGVCDDELLRAPDSTWRWPADRDPRASGDRAAFVILIVFSRLATFDWAVVGQRPGSGCVPAAGLHDRDLADHRPTIIGAALIALSISLDDFVITFFTIGAGNTLPTPGLGHGPHVARSHPQRHRDAAHSAQRRLDLPGAARE
jgi:hypothetical protein